MAEFTYETVDGSQTGFIPNVGEIKNGRITTPVPVFSPNLKLISGDPAPQQAPVVGVSTQQNPNLPKTADPAPTNTGEAQ